MSIFDLKEALRDKPGIHTLTLSYEDGGKVQVVRVGEKEIRLPGAFTSHQIIEELSRQL